MVRLRSLLLSIGLCFLFSCSCVASGQSQDQEKIYKVTESQLTALETRLERLKTINNQLQMDYQNQQTKLTTLQKKSLELSMNLKAQENESKRQEELLRSVNQSFQRFAEQEKLKTEKIKRQRNIWIGVSCLLGYLLCR